MEKLKWLIMVRPGLQHVYHPNKKVQFDSCQQHHQVTLTLHRSTSLMHSTFAVYVADSLKLQTLFTITFQAFKPKVMQLTVHADTPSEAQ
jgi:hypothetical protein